MMKAPFTKQEFFDEVKASMFAFAHEIGRAYTYSRAFALLGLTPPSSEESNYDDPFNAEAFERFDLMKTWLGRDHLSDLYDYAFEARLSSRFDFSVVVEDVAYFLRSLQAHEGVEESQHYETGRRASTEKFQLVMELVFARAVLNEDESFAGDFCRPNDTWSELPKSTALTLRQLSLLAQVDEKTLRNATSSTRNPLKTVSVRGRTFVETTDARRWLQARGQFLPTTYENVDERKLDWQPFLSLEDMAQYVRAQLHAKHPQAADTVLKDNNLLARVLEAQPVSSPDAASLAALADALQFDRSTFAKAFLDVQQEHQKHTLEEELARLDGTAGSV